MSEQWAHDHLRDLADRLLPGRALVHEHCHATVTDGDGNQDACMRPAEHWTIYDPEWGEQAAWPVCYDHANVYTRADSWVEAVSAIPWLLDRIAALESEPRETP